MQSETQTDLSVGFGQILELIRIGRELETRFSRFLMEFRQDFPSFAGSVTEQIEIPRITILEEVSPVLKSGRPSTGQNSTAETKTKTSGRKYKLSEAGRKKIREGVAKEWKPCYHPDCKGGRRRLSSHDHFSPKYKGRYRKP